MSQTQMVRKAIQAILRSLPQSEVVRSVHDSLLNRDDRAILDIRVDPRGYYAACDFAPDYLAANLARKFTGLDTGIDTYEVARSGFLEQEARNRKFNEGEISPTCVRHIADLHKRSISLARWKIAQVLGDFDPLEFAESCSFSSGASYGLPRKFGGAPFKYVHGELEVTSEAYPIAKLLVESSPRWKAEGVSFKLVPGSRFATVPKDSSKDRCIVIDPRMNIYLQKGIGKMIRRRLRRKARVDLNTGHNVNKHLAYLGSIRNEFNLATIDLQAASDSITFRLVADLLPSRWFDVLGALRSHRVKFDTDDGPDWHTLEMFSGMGNGFTFELESLIFWALSSSVMEVSGCNLDPRDSTCKVFGDDIIVPSRHYDGVTGFLEACGFRINEKKSFSCGGFRESCGGHYFLGCDVTPFTIEDVADQAMDLAHIANAYHEWCKRWPGFSSQKCFTYICSLLKKLSKGNVTTVPARFGLKAGIIWSTPEETIIDPAHAGIIKRCRQLPKCSTILVDQHGGAFVQDNDWCNFSVCYNFKAWSYRPERDEDYPESGRYLSALQIMEGPAEVELPFGSSIKGKPVVRNTKTSMWCDFSPLFVLPSWLGSVQF